MVLGSFKRSLGLSLENRMKIELFALRNLQKIGWLSQQRMLWRLGISSEILFWKNYLQGQGWEWNYYYAHQIKPNAPLEKMITELLNAPLGSRVRILDVGAGPLTTLGKVWAGRDVELVPVDVLADHYDELLKDLKVVPVVRTIKADAEHLTEAFQEGSFDLVHARNSIDHCHDPVRAIDEMLAVTRPRGWILLRHLPNEATEQARSKSTWPGAGFHQWDFFAENGEFWISGPKTRTNITKRLYGKAKVNIEMIKSDGRYESSLEWLICRIQKEPTQPTTVSSTTTS
jgi:SAM-dependent methyltransferase